MPNGLVIIIHNTTAPRSPYNKICTGISLEESNKWLTKAACYEARTAWEKGSEISIGPSGFFDTRKDSFDAADVLQMASEANSASVEEMLIKKWYWTNVASELYENGDQQKKTLNNKLQVIEKNMSADSLKRAKALDICSPIRQERK